MYKSLFKPIDPVVAEKYSQSHGLESVYEDVIPMQQPAQQPYQPTTPPVQQQPQQQPAQQVQQPLQQTQQVQQPVQQPQQSQQTQQSQQVQQTPQLMSTIKQLIDANPQAAAIIRNYVNTKAAQLQQTQQQPAQQVQQQSQGTQPVQIAQQPQQPVQESKHGLFGVDMRLVNADAAKGLMKYQTMLKEENETRNALKASMPDGSDNATTKPEKSAEPVSHIDNPFDDDESIKYSPEYNNGDITIKERHDNVKLTNPEPFNPEKPKLTDMSNPTGVGKTVFKQDKDGSDVSESRFVGKHGRIYESIQDPALKATIIQEYINDDKTPDTFSISELHDWIDRNYPEVASDPTFFDSIARDIEQHIIYEDDIDDNSIFSDADGSDDFEDFDDVDEDDIDVSDEVDEYITDSGLFDYDEEDATDWYIEKHPDYEDDDLEDFLDLVSDEYADDMNESFNTMNESRDDDFLESDRFLD